MPDCERLLRKFELYYAEKTSPEKISQIKAFFKGQDNARKQIAVIAIYIFITLLGISFFIGRL